MEADIHIAYLAAVIPPLRAGGRKVQWSHLSKACNPPSSASHLITPIHPQAAEPTKVIFQGLS